MVIEKSDKCINFCSNQYFYFSNAMFQVRKKGGGGTRNITMLKESNKKDIMDAAIKIFFPNGQSTKGSICDFQTDLFDFQEIPFMEGITILELLKKTGK